MFEDLSRLLQKSLLLQRLESVLLVKEVVCSDLLGQFILRGKLAFSDLWVKNELVFVDFYQCF